MNIRFAKLTQFLLHLVALHFNFWALCILAGKICVLKFSLYTVS